MEHSPEVSSSKKQPRRYAFACTNCRKKKIRCDGVQPECTSCVRAEEVCQYPKKRMEAQLAQAQKRIQELESELREARSNSPYGSQSASSPGALYSDSEQDYSIYSQVGFDAGGTVRGMHTELYDISTDAIRSHITDRHHGFRSLPWTTMMKTWPKKLHLRASGSRSPARKTSRTITSTSRMFGCPLCTARPKRISVYLRTSQIISYLPTSVGKTRSTTSSTNLVGANKHSFEVACADRN